jgi:hypothetical protein
MDKKNDHSHKQGQRYSFIDARAANHCYDFHIFPHPDDSCASPDRNVTLRRFGERGVKGQRYRCAAAPAGWRYGRNAAGLVRTYMSVIADNGPKPGVGG